MNRRMAVLSVTVGLALVGLLYNWIDSSIETSVVQSCTRTNLREAILALDESQNVVDLAPKYAGRDIYTTYTVPDGNSYRTLNVENGWVSREIYQSFLLLSNQDTEGPIFKVTGITITPGPEDTASAIANIQFVGPFGDIRETTAWINYPLRHLPVK